MFGLERGFEPLVKGLKPFALTWLCHASDPFLGLGLMWGPFCNLVGFITCGGGHA